MNSKKIGRPTHLIDEPSQVHEIIELPDLDKAGITPEWAKLYKDGYSLNDIADLTGTPRNTIRDTLVREGYSLRVRESLSTAQASREGHKTNIRPFYGFCFFQGKVQPEPKEFNVLCQIHRLWKSGTNPNRIAEILNSKNIPARSAKQWNRNSIVNITNRFKNKQIVIKNGGQYELR